MAVASSVARRGAPITFTAFRIASRPATRRACRTSGQRISGHRERSANRVREREPLDIPVVAGQILRPLGDHESVQGNPLVAPRRERCDPCIPIGEMRVHRPNANARTISRFSRRERLARRFGELTCERFQNCCPRGIGFGPSLRSAPI